MRILITLLILLNAFTARAQDKLPSLNAYVLWAVETMPKGKGYEATQAAVNRLAASVTYNQKTGKITQNTAAAKACFCSGATYLVFLRVIEKLREKNSLTLPPATLARYANLQVKDGEEIFGRWNANGPGTAKLFTELGCGENFTSYDRALPGDFLKIWWTNEIGSRERGHLVVYLGAEIIKGQPHIRYWSANQPSGYGEKTIPRSKIQRALFSRLTRHDRLSRGSSLPPKNTYLANMLTQPFTWRSVLKECRVSRR